MKFHGTCDCCMRVLFQNGDVVLRVSGPWSKSYYNTQYCAKCMSKVKTNPKLKYEKVVLKEEDKQIVSFFTFRNYFSLKWKYPQVVKDMNYKSCDENILYFKEEAPHKLIKYMVKIKYLTPECALECKNFVPRCEFFRDLKKILWT